MSGVAGGMQHSIRKQKTSGSLPPDANNRSQDRDGEEDELAGNKGDVGVKHAAIRPERPGSGRGRSRGYMMDQVRAATQRQLSYDMDGKGSPGTFLQPLHCLLLCVRLLTYSCCESQVCRVHGGD